MVGYSMAGSLGWRASLSDRYLITRSDSCHGTSFPDVKTKAEKDHSQATEEELSLEVRSLSLQPLPSLSVLPGALTRNPRNPKNIYWKCL